MGNRERAGRYYEKKTSAADRIRSVCLQVVNGRCIDKGGQGEEEKKKHIGSHLFSCRTRCHFPCITLPQTSHAPLMAALRLMKSVRLQLAIVSRSCCLGVIKESEPRFAARMFLILVDVDVGVGGGAHGLPRASDIERPRGLFQLIITRVPYIRRTVPLAHGASRLPARYRNRLFQETGVGGTC